jgi:4-oxalocrotonate tautomerase
MPVVHIYTAEGWLSPARKRLMIEQVTAAVVAAEGFPAARDLTYVLVHDVADGGWGFKGHQHRRAEYAAMAPAEPAAAEPA